MKLADLAPRYHRRTTRVGLVASAMVLLGVAILAAGATRSGIVLMLLGCIVAAIYYALVLRAARIPLNSVLIIRLAGAMREVASRSPIDMVRGRRAPSLDDIRRALEFAVTDPRLEAIIVEIAGAEIGMAAAEEIHSMLAAVNGAGKRVIALIAGDQAGLREYLVASGAGEIVINPDTTLLMVGVSAGGLFLRDGLEKAGIGAQTIQRKEYKGAAEMFSRDSMSPAVRESLDALIGDWQEVLTAAVATQRRLPVDRTAELLTRGFTGAKLACKDSLVDRTGYFEDLRAELAPEDADRRMVPLGRYLRRVAYETSRYRRRDRIALIHALGPVIAGEPPAGGEFLSGEVAARAIRSAIEDSRVRAIVMRVNSPGGSAVGSDLVWRAVREARAKSKPLVVSMGDVAASGGYYVAMGADAIVAQASTVTGSIGVVYAKFNAAALLGRVGVAMDFVKRGDSADALSVARPFSAAEMAQLEGVIDEVYGNFTAKVADGRGLAPEAAEAVARGRVWSGRAARENKLVDELGGLAAAIEIARRRANIPPGRAHEVVVFPGGGMLSGMRSALNASTVSVDQELIGLAIGVPVRWVPALIRLMTRGGVMMLSALISP